MKRRESKSKGEKERYTHLNAEFQRRASRNKRAFLRGQCKEIEENNRMGKTRENQRYQGNFSCKDGQNKGQNGMDHAWGWCTGTTQRDGMGREEGGGFRMGNTCIPVADSF